MSSKPMFFEDFKIGQTFRLKPVVITKEKILAFARDYDPLPIHLDEAYAGASRFGGLIAPGVLSFMSVWKEFLRLNVWGDNLVAGKSSSIEWLAPVYPENSLIGVVGITGLTVSNKHNGIVELSVDITNQDGVTVIRNTSETVVRRLIEDSPGDNP